MDSGTQDNPYLLLAVFVFSAVVVGFTPILMAFVWPRWAGATSITVAFTPMKHGKPMISAKAKDKIIWQGKRLKQRN